MPLFDTPLGPNVISTTQNPIRQNFLRIGASFPVNHVNFDTGLTGWHTNLTFPVALATSNPALTANTQIAMLPFTGATSGVCELAIQKFGGTPIAFTEGLNAANGWARLGSGLIVKWGAIGTSATMATEIDLTQGPVFTTQYFAVGNYESLGSTTETTTVNIKINTGSGGPNGNKMLVRAYRVQSTSTAQVSLSSIQYIVIGV